MNLNFSRLIPGQVRNGTWGLKVNLITEHTIKLTIGIFFLLSSCAISAELNPKQEDIFARKTVYTVINKTQDPLDLTWQSGGGSSYDVLNGKQGTLYLSPDTSPSNTGKIITPGDCLDFITAKSRSTGAEGMTKDICKEKIIVQYESPDVKDQKLTIVAN